MNSKGRALHDEAAKAREEERFTESLTFNDDALFAYDADNDALGFSEGIACRSITLRVYANLHDSKRILTLAKYETMASVDLARQSGVAEALTLPLYILAQLKEDLGEYVDAVKDYREAVEGMGKNPSETHNRPSVLANMKVHMTTCEYKAGDKTALERAEQALQELKDSEEPTRYNKDVWVSGAYMRLADAIIVDKPDEAREYLVKAKEIIDSNPDLIIRKKQWEKLSSAISRI
jgi:tetratricopeptide (TPR) repeat protein